MFQVILTHLYVYQIDGFQQKVLLPSGTTKLSFIELFDMLRFTDDNLLLLGLPFQGHVKSLCFIRIVLKIKTLIHRNKTLLYLATCFIDLIRSWTRLATNEQVWFRPTWDAFSRSAKDSAVLQVWAGKHWYYLHCSLKRQRFSREYFPTLQPEQTLKNDSKGNIWDKRMVDIIPRARP